MLVVKLLLIAGLLRNRLWAYPASLLVMGLGLIVSGEAIIPGILLMPVAVLMLGGHFTLQPNEARVLILFGDYHGTVRSSGFFWANPFYSRSRGGTGGAGADHDRGHQGRSAGEPRPAALAQQYQGVAPRPVAQR